MSALEAMPIDWRRHIKAALSYCDGKYTMQDIEARLMNRTAHLMMAERSAAVVWAENYPQKRVLVIAFAGGDLNEILSFIPLMKDYAREVGCQQIDVHGRPGWVKILKRHGFRQVSVTMSLEAL